MPGAVSFGWAFNGFSGPALGESLMAKLLIDTVLSAPKCHYMTFGELNANRIFYVIWRRDQAGFFSNFTYVLMHLQVAEALGLTPVVDFLNFLTLYNEELPVENNGNAWE